MTGAPSPLYPIHLRLAGRLCVVVGGGPVAERKVDGLIAVAARTRVVTLTATPALHRRSEAGEIELILCAYDRVLLENATLVFAATNRRDVNARVSEDAERVGAWVNVADVPDEGDFVTPAAVRRGDLLLSVGTGGNQPMLAARIASELAARFGPEYADLIALLGRMRAEIQATTPLGDERRIRYAAILADEADLRAQLAAGDLAGAEARARAIVTTAQKG